MSEIDAVITRAQHYASASDRYADQGKHEQQMKFAIKAAENYLTLVSLVDDDDDRVFYMSQYHHYIDVAHRLNQIHRLKETSSSKDESEAGAYSFKSESNPTIDFSHVAGMKAIKKDIERKILWPLTDPEGIKRYVGSKCRGVIMYGPPGCGKTLLAKAAAGEAKKRDATVSFFKVDQSDIKDMYVGNSEKKLKNLFKQAAEKQPSIIFFDEVDSLANTRGSELSTYKKDLINEFKSIFDGIKDKTVLVVGATNHPWNIDSAFVRPGRFEELIFVPPPDLKARKEIIRMQITNREIGSKIDIDKLAKLMIGYSGADIEKICNDAGLKAYERKRNYRENTKITYNDFLRVIKQTKPSLKQWCTEVKHQMTDGRYPHKRMLRKGISDEFEVILDIVENLETIYQRKGVF